MLEVSQVPSQPEIAFAVTLHEEWRDSGFSANEVLKKYEGRCRCLGLTQGSRPSVRPIGFVHREREGDVETRRVKQYPPLPPGYSDYRPSPVCLSFTGTGGGADWILVAMPLGAKVSRSMQRRHPTDETRRLNGHTLEHFPPGTLYLDGNTWRTLQVADLELHLPPRQRIDP